MDNLDITPGSGVAQTRTHDDSGVHTQIVKLALGATNADEVIVDSGPQTKANSISITPASDALDAAVFPNAIDLPSASILSTFVSVGSFASDCKIIKLVNTTSVTLAFAISQNTDTTLRVFPYSKEVVDLGPSGLKSAAAVYVKHDGISPGSGNGVASIEAFK